MAKLPNAERALVDIRKLRDYSLNPEHDEGKHKARVFKAALGFTRADAQKLREMYVIDFTTPGLHGNVIIRTAWIVEVDTDFPRLVSCYIREET
jgi:hypothetical protein